MDSKKANIIYGNLEQWQEKETFDADKISIWHINIRSLKKYSPQLDIFIKIIKPDILVITETAMDEDETEIYNIKGYEATTRCRKNQTGGGIAIYIKEEIKIEKTLTPNTKYSEILMLKANIKNQLKLWIVATYRPPNKSKKLFLKEIENLLNDQQLRNVVMIGDVNIDTLKNDDAINIRYKNMMAEQEMIECIQGITREAIRKKKITKTCIDHIWAKNLSVRESAIIRHNIADHFPVGIDVAIKTKSRSRERSGKGLKRVSIINNKTVYTKIVKEAWEYNEEESVEENYTNLVEKMNKIYSESKQTIEKKENEEKEWINEELLELTRKKEKAWNLHKENVEDELIKKNYHDLDAKVKKETNKAKFVHEREKFTRVLGNPRKLWENINETTGRKRKPNLDEMIVKNFNITNKEEEKQTANLIAESLIQELDRAVIKCNQKINNATSRRENRGPEMINWNSVNEEEIKKIINQMDEKKAPGVDGIRLKDIKDNEDLIKITTQIVNTSLKEGKIPKLMKVAIVRAIHKKGDKDNPLNYRPLQILSQIEKILEKVAYNQLNEHLTSNNIIVKQQYGYQKKKSTTLLLEDFADKINTMLHFRLQPVILFLDFSKAFDTLSKNTIIRALNNIGIKGEVEKWFTDYLTERKIRVKINDTMSEEYDWTTGVPQGSLLGPMLYNVVANGIVKEAIKETEAFLYADDTILVAGARDVETSFKKIDRDLKRLQSWTHDHGLVLNKKKTVVMHITKREEEKKNVIVRFHTHECLHNKNADCQCDEKVHIVSSQKYVGLTIDDNFNFREHFSDLNTKLRRLTFAFNAIKNKLPTQTKRAMYFALVESIVAYGITSYGVGQEANLKTLEKLQIKILRYVHQRKCTEKDLFTELNILPFSLLYKYKQIQMNKNEFNQITEHNYNLRTNKRIIPMAYNKNGEKMRCIEIPTLLNDIPEEILKENRTGAFKKQLKQHLIRQLP